MVSIQKVRDDTKGYEPLRVIRWPWYVTFVVLLASGGLLIGGTVAADQAVLQTGSHF